jgi:putative DNA primase/helicase
VVDGLRAAAYLSDGIAAPAWLDHVPYLEAADIIACKNGLLHIPSAEMLPHTPRFFTQNALDFAFDPSAPEPAGWLKFLSELWPEDPQSIGTLQQIFGLAVTADTGYQKAFLLIGPKRSGRGTIFRVLGQMIGRDNTVAATLSGIGTNFGLAPLIGKRLALIGDARLSGRVDQQATVERLLSITGEDDVTIDRKYMAAWTGRLQTRFLILSNELPRLADASGALASRFIVLLLTRSFYGGEDIALTGRLLTELPGILNWSLAGLNRLRERGFFVQPESASQTIQDLEDLGSPISAFIRERCKISPELNVDRIALFGAWKTWCRVQGIDQPGTAMMFGKNLHAAVRSVGRAQPTEGGRRLASIEASLWR